MLSYPACVIVLYLYFSVCPTRNLHYHVDYVFLVVFGIEWDVMER